MSYKEEALQKLERESAAAKYDRYAQVMYKDVKNALAEFCRQDEEFAQAVVQGKSFGECMIAVARGCGSGISDLEAYRRAVRFYFPGSDIRVQMSIDLTGAAGNQHEQGTGAIILDIAQFL